jgi:hypothetical protein
VQPPADAGAPSILVGDLAAAQAAVASVVTGQREIPATPDARSPEVEAELAGVRADVKHQAGHAASHFDEHEEQFFQAGSSPTFGHAAEPTESFNDLDDGYQPTGFWDKLLGRDKKPRRRPPPKR